jgi:hypothetical protein
MKAIDREMEVLRQQMEDARSRTEARRPAQPSDRLARPDIREFLETQYQKSRKQRVVNKYDREF